MGEEITIGLDEYRRLVNADMKLDMLIDALLNNAALFHDQLCIYPDEFCAILMVFEPEGYKNAVEWLKKKGEKDG